MLTDILWNDPDDDVFEWEESERGSGYLFGKE